MGELMIKVNEMFAKYGLTDETLKLSQELDEYIVEEQKELLSKWKS